MKKSLSGFPLMCSHTLTQCQDSVLVMTVTDRFLFAGTQSGIIHVWNIDKFSYFCGLEGHKGHVLSLAVSEDGYYLFSGGDEGYVRVWVILDTEIKCKFIIHAGPDCGDIHSIVYSDVLNVIYLGCKNSSIQYFDLTHRNTICKTRTRTEWGSRDSRFFDLIPLEEQHREDKEVEFFVIFPEMIYPMSHNGFVYTLALGTLPSNKDADTESRLSNTNKSIYLFSGSGDGCVKIWNVNQLKPVLCKSLQVSEGSVLCLTTFEGLLITGAQDGELKVWDLETFQCIRTLIGHTNDILSVLVIKSVIFSCSADGTIKKWNKNFECVDTMMEHRGIVLSLANNSKYLFSGGNDKMIKIWEIPPTCNDLPLQSAEEYVEDWMISSLKKFVSYPSVSNSSVHFEQSRHCAKFLRCLFEELGADAKIVPTLPEKNPLVLAKFQSDNPVKNVLIYGHYDVQPAKAENWMSDPFKVTGIDGYLYGRGVTDNKGPILAMMFATAELLEARNLAGINVYFAIEGEEESGSGGFCETIEANQDFFDNNKIDLVILSNSYWLDDQIPCITYGLRGVVHTNIKVSSSVKQDLHSGVSGGVYDEPLNDLISVLSRLRTIDKKVNIPDFYSNVTPLSQEEIRDFQELVSKINANKPETKLNSISVENLISRWRNPTVTIHKIEVTGPESNTVIPRSANAAVSMRIVPNQDLRQICESYERHLTECFNSLQTQNTLSIRTGHTANWWVEDYKSCPYFKIASEAIEKVWKVKPLFIREGGSIPAVPFLKKFFGASVLHIPMGQSSDNAHLPNERIRLENLTNGKEIIKLLIQSLK